MLVKLLQSSYSLPNGKLENCFYFALLELHVFLSVIKYTSKGVIMAIVIAVWGPALCFILQKAKDKSILISSISLEKLKIYRVCK